MYSIRNFGEMILDAERMDAYVRALRQSVRPGSVVLDIGTGTGIFALLAARFGARRVFAVEPGEAIQAAREIAAANGLADRIEFIQAVSTAITLPERADVIVSDLHGVLPFFGRHLASIADARRRHLAPGGAMIPRRDTVWVSVVEAPEAHRDVTSPWSDNAYGLDMRAARNLAANTCVRVRLEPPQLLAAAQTFAVLDYARVEHPGHRAELAFTVGRDGTGHGLALWFDSVLADGIELSNAPASPRLIYGNLFLPWPEPIGLARGERVEASLRADLVGEDYVWSWTTRVGGAPGHPRVRFEQSEFLGAALSPATLRKQAASHVAALNDDGEVDRLVLELMGGSASLGDIARRVAERFPHRFPSWQDALTRVGEISVRYGR